MVPLVYDLFDLPEGHLFAPAYEEIFLVIHIHHETSVLTVPEKRSGESSFSRSCTTPSQTICASNLPVIGARLMPSPSCPAAVKNPGSPACSPSTIFPSGVAGRRPAMARMKFTSPRTGRIDTA